MEKRYQVFVSSTFVDLKDERTEVIQALLELDCIPASMELFPAANENAWSLIERVIRECDYYIVIVGGRYGSLTEEGISYTEREYDYATSIGKPVLGFVHGQPDQIVIGKAELDGAAQERLALFRRKVESKLVKTWTSPAELGAVVSRSLTRLMRDHPGEGWVRGRHAITPEIEADYARQQARVAELELAIEREQRATHHDLADGDEQLTLAFRVTWPSTKQMRSFKTDLSWNEIFSIVATDDLISRSTITDALRQTFRERLVDAQHGQSEESLSEAQVSVFGSGASAIITQFRALGLIARAHDVVGGDGQYWRLTKQGETRYLREHAIRSTRARSTSPREVVTNSVSE